MYKDTKWAKEILAQQDENGLWGNFHTLSKPSKAPITTEQALRRLYVLGFDINDEAIARTVTYMSDCLKGRKQMPDRREKMHNWDIFTELMLAVWIRKFTLADRSANRVAGKWADIITRAFSSGSFSHEDCALAYTEIFGEPPRGGRLVDFVTFYQLSLLPGMLNERTERLMMDYVLHYDKGIYYVFSRPSGDSRICNVPETFASREAGGIQEQHRHAAFCIKMAVCKSKGRRKLGYGKRGKRRDIFSAFRQLEKERKQDCRLYLAYKEAA